MSDMYDDGYQDGLEDALTKVRANAETVEDAIQEIRRLQGWKECPACEGSGEREPTDRDLLKGLLVAAGGVTDLSRPCQTCWGERMVTP